MWRGLILLLVALPAAAHPLPTMRYDRTVEVVLNWKCVFVSYQLELNEWSMVLDKEVKPTAQESAAINAAPPSQRAGEKLYAQKRGAMIADQMIATANGQVLRFRLDNSAIYPNQDHLQFRYEFRADWPSDLTRSKPIHFSFDDNNFESVVGKMSLTIKAESGLIVQNLIEPGNLSDLSPLELKPGDEAKLRKTSAMITLPEAPEPFMPSPLPREPAIQVATPSLVQDFWGGGIAALIHSDAGTDFLLLTAMLFGMAHAFTPGHGKTLVAAYLVGERGTIRHALVLGISTTLAHTGSVICIAIVLNWVYGDNAPQTVQGWLQFAGGSLILIVGLWLFMQRLRGRADHVHLFNDHPRDKKSFGWGRVLLLGLGGGLIPCWDAVMLLLVAISVGRLAFAIPMLIAFSVGLAAVLVALGIGVVLAHRAGLARFGERRWFKALPIVSAALLVMMGFWLAREGVQQLSQAAKG